MNIYRQIPIFVMLKEMQSLEDSCLVVDISRTFDREGACAFGVDLEKILVVQPANSYQAIESMETNIGKDNVRLIIVIGCETILSGDKIEHISVLSRIHDVAVVFVPS